MRTYRVHPLKRIAKFVWEFYPVFALHALVPTLASAEGLERPLALGWYPLRLAVSLPLDLPTLEKHFMFSWPALREGRWWTSVTHMLLHRDTRHALSNLESALAAGPAVTDTIGVPGAVLCYFFSGVAAALDPFGFGTLQFERIFAFKRIGLAERARRFSRENLSFELAKVVDRAADAVNEVWKSVSIPSVAQMAQDNARSFGASGGISAFAAIDACASAVELLDGRRRDPLSIISAGMHVMSSVRYFAREWHLIETGECDQIGHGAHLTGATVGVATYLAFRFWRRTGKHAQWRGG